MTKFLIVLLPSKTPELKNSQLVTYFRCPFSLAYVTTSYGCYCSYCTCSIRVEKKEEITTTQEHKKPTSKKNPRNSKPGKICPFQHQAIESNFFRIKLKRKEKIVVYVNDDREITTMSI